MLEGQDLTIRAEDASDDSKYHPRILQDTFYSRIMTITNKIKSEEKFNYLRHLYSSFEDALKCDECFGVLEADSISFNCDHKFCKKCSIEISACSLCTKPGYDRSCQHTRDFSFLLKNIAIMQRDYNAESIVFNLVRFLVDPAGTTVKEDLICKPLPQIAKSNFSTPRARKTARKSSTTKRTAQKSNESARSKRRVNPSPPRTDEYDSAALFTDFKTETAKNEENRRSYLERQESILSPKFNKNTKTYSRNAKRKLPSTDFNANSPSQETRLKKQKELIHDKNAVNTPPKMRNSSRKNSLGLDGQSEAKKDTTFVSSARKSRRKLSTESFESVSDYGLEGTFSGFEQMCVVEGYNKLKSVKDHYRNCRAKLEPTNVIDDGSDGTRENLTDESGCEANKRGLRRSSRFRNTKSVEASPKIFAKQNAESSSQRGRVNTFKNEKSFEKLASKKNLEEPGTTKERIIRASARGKKKIVLETNEKDTNVTDKKTLKGISERRTMIGADEDSNLKKDDEDTEIDQSTNKMEKENSDANTSDYDTEDVEDITSKLWDRSNRRTRKKKTFFKSLQERKNKNVLLKLLEEKKLQKEKHSQDKSITKTDDGVIVDAVVEDQSALPAKKVIINSINEEFHDEDPVEQKSLQEDSTNSIQQTTSCNLGYARKLSSESNSNARTPETKTWYHSSENNEQLLPINNEKSTTGEMEILPHDCEKLSLKNGSQSTPEVTVAVSSGINCFQFVLPKIPDGMTSAEENYVEQFPQESSSKSIFEETRISSSDVDCVKQLSPKVSPRGVIDEKVKSAPKPACAKQKIENTIEKSLETENDVTLEDVSTPPSLNKSKFHNTTITPMLVRRLGEQKSVSSSVFNPLTNTSTPVANNGNAKRPGEEEKENSPAEFSSDNDETLKLNKCGSSTTNELSYSPDEIVSREDASYKLAIKRKCANLKRAINSQNQKSLFSLKKNFAVTSPHSLLIERQKTTTSSADKHRTQNESDVDPCEVEKSIDSVESDSSHSLNASNPISTREVACQTSSDLHLALLKQEFPHLFQRSSLPLSVYDSPVQSGTKFNVGTSSVIRTPEHLIRDYDIRAKFSTVSSITTSEKKRAEEEFASHSILYDSLRTPVNFPSTNNSPADISSISFLPSSEKKVAEFTPTNDPDRCRMGVRLNFQKGLNLYSKDDLKESPSASLVSNDDEFPCSKDIVPGSDNSIVYRSKKDSLATTEKLTLSVCSINETDEIRSASFNVTNELELADTRARDKEVETVKENIFNGEKDAKTTFTADPDFIPDSAVPTEDDVEIFKDEEKYKSEDVDDHRTPAKKQNSDDEDVDFIAATPTCNDKGLPENNTEKLQSQRSLVTANEVDTLDEKSYPLFDTNPCQTPEPAKTVHQSTTAVHSQSESASRNANFSIKSAANEKLIFFATSGLKDTDFNLVKAFCEKFSVIMQNQLTVESTHLIVKTDDENRASRTFKYLQAIVNGLTIVSVGWVAKCLEHGFIVNEENFIPLDSSSECGPLRAYNVGQGLTPSPLSWLRDYCLLFQEPIPQGCTLKQLQEIVRKTGAVVVDSLEEMDLYPRHHHVIIISDDEEDMEDITKYIKYWLQKYQAVAIEFNWLLEIIGRNRLVPFCDHEFAEIRKDILVRYKFPGDMLNSI